MSRKTSKQVKPTKALVSRREVSETCNDNATANALDYMAQRILWRALRHDLATAKKLNKLGDNLAKMAGTLRK